MGAFGCTLGLCTASGLDLKCGVGPLEVSKGAWGGQNDEKGTKIIQKGIPVCYLLLAFVMFFPSLFLDESEF